MSVHPSHKVNQPPWQSSENDYIDSRIPTESAYPEGYPDYSLGNPQPGRDTFIGERNALIEWLTPEELERDANAEQLARDTELERYQFVLAILARNPTPWHERLTPEEEDWRRKSTFPDRMLQVFVALREMTPADRAHHDELTNRFIGACDLMQELMNLANQRQNDGRSAR